VIRGRTGTSGKGDIMGKGVRRVNMVQKCVHMYVNAKMIPVKNTPGIGKGGKKEYDRGGEFIYDVFDTL
jgi:hypothetical protein